jgi:hypothetical protein
MVWPLLSLVWSRVSLTVMTKQRTLDLAFSLCSWTDIVASQRFFTADYNNGLW